MLSGDDATLGIASNVGLFAPVDVTVFTAVTIWLGIKLMPYNVVMISLIAAKARNNVIGANNDLPWYLPGDLKRFKELTTGHTVVMGRKTYESIVARLGHALPNRRNVVMTRQVMSFEGAETLHDLAGLQSLGDVIVIGGAELYKTTIDSADRLYVTEVKATLSGNAFFPFVDPRLWWEVSREPHKKDEKNQYDFDFVTYDRRSASP